MKIHVLVTARNTIKFGHALVVLSLWILPSYIPCVSMIKPILHPRSSQSENHGTIGFSVVDFLCKLPLPRIPPWIGRGNSICHNWHGT